MSNPSSHRPRPSASAAPLSAYARIERISEPWSLNRTFAIACTLGLAMLFGSWSASGHYENLVLCAVWLGAVMIIVFVQDHWWSPALIITALAFSTTAAGFPMSGMEIGVVILALTFPVKMAMKTLRKAEPEMSPGILYWLLLGYVCVHAVVIIFYSKVEGVQLRNIVKSYYEAITPLVFYGLLIRFCHTRTVRPTAVALFFTNLLVVAAAILLFVTGVALDPFVSLRISIPWLQEGGIDALRWNAPMLFIGCIAFWPAVRPGIPRFILGVALALASLGTLLSGGRLSMVLCVVAGIFFAAVRRKLWLALPFVVITALTSAFITAVPESLYSLPETVQRALAPLNFSDQKTEVQDSLEGSDNWHKDLRDRSFEYWQADTNSFWLGHGFKAWDYELSDPNDVAPGDYDRWLQKGVEMGLTENMFSAITNIFGLTGLILYGAFLCNLAWSLFKASRISPPGSGARALCEFSLVNLLPAIVLCPFMGGVPSLALAYWTLGLLAARPYIVAAQKAQPAPAPAEQPSFAKPAYAGRTPFAQPPRLRPGRI
jgi:hypothetical protein